MGISPDDHTVRVFGLARSNILYQYRSGDVWTTVYQYSVNETISLACVLNILPSGNYKFKWNFNGEESSRNGYTVKGMMKYADENFIKTLTEHDDKKIIKCIVYENYKILNFAEIRLQLKEISNSENFEDEINPHTSNNLIIIFACISGLVLTITVVGIVYWRKRTQRPKTTSNTEVPTSQPFYGNKMFQNDPNRGIYVLPENNDPKYEKASQAPCNRVKEDNEMTPIPESMYDSCSSENSTIQPNNDVPKSPDCSDPNHHYYEEVNYLQCKPKPSEPQQRSSKIYNVAYDHVRRCRSGK
uniref:SFRICE_032965 n=1 Tax=Spodoptera frugiperda TaxID=7108 RepID=A0A2H1WSJ9_SPOFR